MRTNCKRGQRIPRPRRNLRRERAFFGYMRECGFPFPSSYVVLDIETSGRYGDRHLILQAGHLEVDDGKPYVPTAVMLDWTRMQDMSQGYLRQDIAELDEE